MWHGPFQTHFFIVWSMLLWCLLILLFYDKNVKIDSKMMRRLDWCLPYWSRAQLSISHQFTSTSIQTIGKKLSPNTSYLDALEPATRLCDYRCLRSSNARRSVVRNREENRYFRFMALFVDHNSWTSFFRIDFVLWYWSSNLHRSHSIFFTMFLCILHSHTCTLNLVQIGFNTLQIGINHKSKRRFVVLIPF